MYWESNFDWKPSVLVGFGQQLVMFFSYKWLLTYKQISIGHVSSREQLASDSSWNYGHYESLLLLLFMLVMPSHYHRRLIFLPLWPLLIMMRSSLSCWMVKKWLRGFVAEQSKGPVNSEIPILVWKTSIERFLITKERLAHSVKCTGGWI